MGTKTTRMTNGHQVTTQTMDKGQGQGKEGTTGVAEAQDTTCLKSLGMFLFLLFYLLNVFLHLELLQFDDDEWPHPPLHAIPISRTNAGLRCSCISSSGLGLKTFWALSRYVSFIMFFYSALNDYLVYIQNEYNHHHNNHQPARRERNGMGSRHTHYTLPSHHQ